MKRVWVPGWQMRNNCFDAIKNQLKAQHETTLSFIDEQASVEDWLVKTIEQITEPTQIIGWSLGGALAYQLASRNDWIKSCLMINTNTDFSGPNGLDISVSEAFMARYRLNPIATRKRFALLVDKNQSKAVESYLCAGDQHNTLQWLYDFSAKNHRVAAPCHVLLSAQDQLVPFKQAIRAWHQQQVDSITELDAQHSAPVFAYNHISEWIRSHE